MNQKNTQLALLNAALKLQESHDAFRNRHLVEMTGINKSLVAHHLKKWEAEGFAIRNPLNKVEWILTRGPELLEKYLSEDTPTHVAHMMKLKLFDDEQYQTITKATEQFAALKALGLTLEAQEFLGNIETYIDNAIDELRNERYYLHQRRMSPKVAAKTLKKLGYKNIPGVRAKLIESKMPTATEPVLELVKTEEQQAAANGMPEEVREAYEKVGKVEKKYAFAYQDIIDKWEMEQAAKVEG